MAKHLRVAQREQCIGCYSCMYSCSRTWFNVMSPEKAALRVRNYSGAEGAFSIRACYGCIDPDCIKPCPTQAITQKAGGGVEFHADKCIHCGKCVAACIPKALQWDAEKRMPIICRHCGICVSFCPNGVLEMRSVNEQPGGGA